MTAMKLKGYRCKKCAAIYNFSDDPIESQAACVSCNMTEWELINQMENKWRCSVCGSISWRKRIDGTIICRHCSAVFQQEVKNGH